MDHAAPMRQRVLALFLPAAAVLYICAGSPNPKGTDRIIPTTADAFKVLLLPHCTRLSCMSRARSRFWL